MLKHVLCFLKHELKKMRYQFCKNIKHAFYETWRSFSHFIEIKLISILRGDIIGISRSQSTKIKHNEPTILILLLQVCKKDIKWLIFYLKH